MKLRSFFTVLYALFFVSSSVGQTGILASFQVQPIQEEVVLNWTIKKGQTCFGTTILRSTDSIHFESIGKIEGICGDEATAASYTFIDTDPIKGAKSYYRLELGNDNPSHILTAILRDFGTQKVLIYPMPANEVMNVILLDGERQPNTAIMVDLYGKIHLVATFQSNSVSFPMANLPIGQYTLIITSSVLVEPLAKKFLILR